MDVLELLLLKITVSCYICCGSYLYDSKYKKFLLSIMLAITALGRPSLTKWAPNNFIVFMGEVKVMRQGTGTSLFGSLENVNT